MFGAPSLVPEVGSELCLPRFHPCVSCEGLSIPSMGQSCQERGATRHGFREQAFEPLGRLQLQIFAEGYWL